MTAPFAPRADVIARGLIAICNRFGSDPLSVFDRNRLGNARVRACVAAALIQMAEDAGAERGATARIARLLVVPSTRLAPSGLKRSEITLLDLDVAIKAMTGAPPASSILPESITIKMAQPRTSFDPASLGRGRTAAAAPKHEDVVERGEEARAEAYVGLPDDTRLVEACRRQGGFPIVHLKGPQRGLRSWPGSDGRHG